MSITTSKLATAETLLKQNKFLEAKIVLNSILEKDLQNIKAKYLHAIAIEHLFKDQQDISAVVNMCKEGQFFEALNFINNTFPNTPLSPQYLNLLGVIYQNINQHEKAIEYYNCAVKESPYFTAAHNNLGNTYSAIGNYAPAVAAYHKALEVNENYDTARVNLVSAYSKFSNFDAALKHARVLVDNNKNNFAFLHQLAELHKTMFSIKEAIAIYNLLIQKKFKTDLMYFRLASCFHSIFKTSNAFASIHSAMSLNPNNLEYKLYHSNLLLEKGSIADANQQLREILDIDPLHPEALYFLSRGNDLEFDETLLSKIKLRLNDNAVPEVQKKDYSFALANHFHRSNNHTDAGYYFYHGNEYAKNVFPDTSASDKVLLNDIPSIFEKVKSQSISLDNEQQIKHTPIFIVGMPRSGTTLLEQILSGDPQIFGAGELDILSQLILQHMLHPKDFTTSAVIKIRKHYLKKLCEFDVSEKYITDKLPLNFRWVGLIYLIFPEAKVIHISRKKLENIWSIYKSNFATQGNSFGNDPRKLINYYDNYEKLMQYWNTVLPNLVLNLSYEELALNPGKILSQLSAFLNFQLAEECIDIKRNKRQVSTLSNIQVRSTISLPTSDSKNYTDFIKIHFTSLFHER